MPKRKCGKTSCRNYVDYSEQYCEKHSGSNHKTYNRTIRYNSENKEYTEFYNGKAWRKLSAEKRKEQPLCEHCLAEGRVKAADLVDHIIELKDDWEKRLEWSNLQSLCFACHNVKTNLEKQKR